MYNTTEELISLEHMNYREIRQAIDEAMNYYEECQVYYDEQKDLYDIDILIDTLKHIELYIRKAENILHNYDGYKKYERFKLSTKESHYKTTTMHLNEEETFKSDNSSLALKGFKRRRINR